MKVANNKKLLLNYAAIFIVCFVTTTACTQENISFNLEQSQDDSSDATRNSSGSSYQETPFRPTNSSLSFPMTLLQGGTGLTAMATPYAPVCAGKTATGSLQVASIGLSNSGYVLLSNGSNALPSFQDVSASGAMKTITGNSGGTLSGANINFSGGTTGLSFSGSGTTETLTGTLIAGHGGTGFASYTTGDLLYASGATALSKLSDVATGNALISGGVGVAPSYGKIDVTAATTGATNHAVQIGSSTGTLSSLGLGTTTTVLHGNASGDPTFGSVLLSTDVSGATAHAVQIGSSTGTLSSLGLGTTTTVLHGNAAGDPTFGSVSLSTDVSGATNHAVQIGNLTGTLSSLGLGTSTTVLHGNASGDPTFGLVALTTDVSGVLPVASGGTNIASYTTGDLVYASGATTLSILSDVATGNALISGGVGVAPSYGKIDVTAATTGATNHAVQIGNSTGTLSSLGLGTAITVLHGNSSGDPTFGSVALTTDVSGVLPVASGGTNIASYTTGDLVYASGATTLSILSDVATGNALISGGVGVAPSYGKIDVTAATTGATNHAVQIGNSTGTLSSLGLGTAITVLHGNSSGDPTFGSVALTTDVSGVLPVASGGTNIASYTTGDLLYASGATTLSILSDVAVGNALISGGVGAAPSYGKVDVTAATTGAINHAVQIGSSTGTLSSLGLGTSTTVLHGNAAGDPTFGSVSLSTDVSGATNHAVQIGSSTGTLSSLGLGTATTVLHGNASGDPTFGSVSLSTDVSGTLSVASGGTGTTSLNTYNILIGEGTGTVQFASPGNTGIPLISTGSASNPGFGTALVIGGGTGVTTMTTAYAPVCAGTTAAGALQVASTGLSNSGYVLTSNGANALPSFQPGTGGITTITGDTGGALTGSNITFTGGTTGLSFGGSGTAETLTFAGITANGGTVNLATDVTTSVINVGTGAGIKTTIVGSTNSTSSTTVRSGSGALNVTATNGALMVNSGTGALGVSTDSTATTVSLGTGAGVKAVTLGSTNTTSTTNLQAGSGGINIPAFAEGALITSSAGKISTVTGTAGYVLTANASGTAPSFQVLPAGSGVSTITGDTGGALTGSNITFTGGTTGLSFGGSATTETLTGTLIVGNGGTGNTTLIAHNVLLGQGTSAIAFAAPGNTGIPLVSAGFATDPVFGTALVLGGGTGNTTLTQHGVLLGEGTSAIVATTAGTNGQILIGSTSADPSFVTPTVGTGLSLTTNATTLSYALSTPVSTSSGGTGNTSYTTGDLLYASGTTTLSKLSDVAVGNALISGGVGAAPSYGKVDVTAATTGATNHAVQIGSSTGTLSSLGLGTSTTVLHGNATGNPTFSSVVLTTDVSGTLPVASGGTGTTSLNTYNILIGEGTGVVQFASPGNTGIPLVSTGSTSNPTFGTALVLGGGTGNTTLTQHGVLLGEGTSAIVATTAGTNGQILIGSTSADPSFVTPTVGTGLSLTTNATTLSYALSIPVSTSSGGTGNTTLTAHNVLLGEGTSAIAFAFPGNTGIPLVSAGSATDPAFGTALVLGGGTGVTTMTTAYAPVCAGTTATGSLQVASTGLSNSGYVLTSNGSSALPSFQDVSACGAIKTITGDSGGALSSSNITFAGGTTGLSFGGSGTTETLTFAGITANGGAVNLATDATTSAINVGTGAGVKTTSVGSTNTTSSTTVQSGTGALNLTATNGALTVNSGTGALGVSNDAAATIVSLCTGAGVKTVTLGSTNTTSTTNLQAGSGE